MKKQPQAGVGHHHVVFVGRLGHVTIPRRSARLGHVPHVAAACPVDVVAEGDQGVRRQADPVKAGEICPAFLCRDR